MLLFGLSTVFVHTCHFFHSIYMEGAECNGIYMIKMLLRANLATLYNEYQIALHLVLIVQTLIIVNSFGIIHVDIRCNTPVVSTE